MCFNSFITRLAIHQNSMFVMTVLFLVVFMLMSTISTMAACFVIHIGKGYDGWRRAPPYRLLDFATLLSKLFCMTDDTPMNRSDLKGIEKIAHQWRFIAAMIDRLFFLVWLTICIVFGIAFGIYVHT